MINAMGAPFYRAFSDELKIPAANIRALVVSCFERKQTGVIRLISDNDELLYLLIKKGSLINSYLASAQTRKVVLAEVDWGSWIDAIPEAYTKFIPLSLQGLFICKLLIQNTGGESKVFIQPNGIEKHLETLWNTPGVSLVQLDWKNSTGAVFISGAPAPPYSLFISPEVLQDQPNIASAILNPDNQQCTATTFWFDPFVDAWQEYLLRKSFADIYEKILTRFQIITGHAMVDSLVRLTIAIASRHHLEINIVKNNIVDDEVFSSAEQAAENYRMLLTEMFMHFAGITGSRLLSATLREIVTNLPAQERTTISTFSLLTEGYIYERKA
jgi:hypothetical protein